MNADQSSALARIPFMNKTGGSAGVGAGENIEAITLKEWRWVMSINLEGTMLGTRKAIAAMKNTGCGSIVNISSIEGLGDDAAKARAELEAKHPLGHLGEPDDVAYAVLYLASGESRFVTGSKLVVDGGYTAQ